jgi:hypothetical protein
MAPKASTRSSRSSKSSKNNGILDIVTVETDKIAPTRPPALPSSPSPTSCPSPQHEDNDNPFTQNNETDEKEAPDNSRVTWSDEMLEQLVNFILQCHRDGKTSGGGMKKDLWQAAANQVNKATRGYTISWDKCKNKWGSDIKEKWKYWNQLRDMSGFGWNEEKELYEAYDYVWDNLNKSHPRIIWHKTHVMYMRDELQEILFDNQASGEGALAGTGDEGISNNYLNIDPRFLQQDTESVTSSLGSEKAPKGGYNRSKKRVKSEVSEDTDVSGKQKKVKNQVDIGMALAGLSATLGRVLEEKKEHKTDSQKAVQLLESVYGKRLGMMEFINACAFFKDDKNAGIFLSITDVQRRDRWLEINLSITLEEEEVEEV